MMEEHSRTFSEEKRLSLYFLEKRFNPLIWSPCSCVMTTAVSDEGSIPHRKSLLSSSRALKPASTRTLVFPDWIYVLFPELPLPSTLILSSDPHYGYRTIESTG